MGHFLYVTKNNYKMCFLTQNTTQLRYCYCAKIKLSDLLSKKAVGVKNGHTNFQ